MGGGGGGGGGGAATGTCGAAAFGCCPVVLAQPTNRLSINTHTSNRFISLSPDQVV